VDHLVCNAGVASVGAFEEIPDVTSYSSQLVTSPKSPETVCFLSRLIYMVLICAFVRSFVVVSSGRQFLGFRSNNLRCPASPEEEPRKNRGDGICDRMEPSS
jgi:hypothetical protein